MVLPFVSPIIPYCFPLRSSHCFIGLVPYQEMLPVEIVLTQGTRLSVTLPGRKWFSLWLMVLLLAFFTLFYLFRNRAEAFSIGSVPQLVMIGFESRFRRIALLCMPPDLL
jgi:hypothetical protein